ncbi:MAG: BolA family transcriptional regulator [Deltaproteobacteria bacterium]|nr:BolA family transcriptional regulator [Deltaproteobacteria bacterium]
MSREERIKDYLENEYSPVFLEVENESHKHNVPVDSETHFNVVVVSEAFAGKNRVQRQRMINHILKAELDSGLHSLTMKIWTRAEYEAKGEKVQNSSPPCLGGFWNE